jgi:plastocyanin
MGHQDVARRFGGVPRAVRLSGAALLVGAFLTACGGTAAPSAAAQRYAPQDRSFTVTLVPLATHEQEGTFDYLKEDFAKGGILDGKEVYGMSPSNLTVYQGDRVTIHFINPADDEHPIAASGLNAAVDVKGQSTADMTFVANKAGLFQIACTLPEHAPYMNGQLVVLPDSDAPTQ